MGEYDAVRAPDLVHRAQVAHSIVAESTPEELKGATLILARTVMALARELAALRDHPPLPEVFAGDLNAEARPHRRPAIEDGTVEQDVIDGLRALADNYGAVGVVRVAHQLWGDAVWKAAAQATPVADPDDLLPGMIRSLRATYGADAVARAVLRGGEPRDEP